MFDVRNNIFIRIILVTLLVATSVYALKSESVRTSEPGSQITLRLAEALPEHNPVTIAMRRFAALVKEKTNGVVTVKIHSSAQFGQESEAIEQVQLGIIDLTRVNSVVVANVSPSMGVFTLPYIFRNFEHKYGCWTANPEMKCAQTSTRLA